MPSNSGLIKKSADLLIPCESVKYTSLTSGIKVSVVPIFLDDNSNPAEGYYVWAYNVDIKNCRNSDVQLMTRHWWVIDSNGVSTEVEGIGVVGEQPVISIGDKFEYTSGTYLYTPSGIMYGEYGFLQADIDETFKVKVPIFSLDSSYDNGHSH